MTVEQTVNIPANRRLIIDVPSEVPAGRTIIAFTPVTTASKIEPGTEGINRGSIPETGSINTGKKIHLTTLMIDEMMQDETIRSLTGILHMEMSLEEIREERLAKYLK
jgi:hypothetical protein